jgi:hypothetical protein
LVSESAVLVAGISGAEFVHLWVAESARGSCVAESVFVHGGAYHLDVGSTLTKSAIGEKGIHILLTYCLEDLI